MRTFLVWLARLILRIFFRRVEVVGEEKVPAQAPVIFALNHPSALVDPMFILALSSRPVHFLAKEPLFRMPIVGAMVRGAGCLPVYRAQDNADLSKNKATFEQARAIVGSGGAIAIFPEGTSHDDPKLRVLKTGLARIALGAAASADAAAGQIQVVPAGLYYSDKGRFRSEALLCYGDAIPVVPAGLGPEGEPPAEAVRELTSRIGRGLDAVTLQWEKRETLDAIAWAERLYAAEGDRETHGLAGHFDLRRRFVAGYAELRERRPRELLDVAEKVLSYDRQLAALGLGPSDLPAAPFTGRLVARELASALFWLCFAPLALAGAVLHYPAYQLIRAISSQIAGDEVDAVATIKVFAAMAFYPLTWLALTAFAIVRFGPWAGCAIAMLAPLSGWLALVLRERWRRLRGGWIALGLFLFRRPHYESLIAERRAIRDAIARLAGELGTTAAATAGATTG
ncbi:MAG TPA: lysophospholipid acyltransferase family protein [Myxococcales bacterium]|nr:lysophospholipid acyltransferase family protein [Myxococcales bacterium]